MATGQKRSMEDNLDNRGLRPGSKRECHDGIERLFDEIRNPELRCYVREFVVRNPICLIWACQLHSTDGDLPSFNDDFLESLIGAVRVGKVDELELGCAGDYKMKKRSFTRDRDVQTHLREGGQVEFYGPHFAVAAIWSGSDEPMYGPGGCAHSNGRKGFIRGIVPGKEAQKKSITDLLTDATVVMFFVPGEENPIDVYDVYRIGLPKKFVLPEDMDLHYFFGPDADKPKSDLLVEAQMLRQEVEDWEKRWMNIWQFLNRRKK